MKEITPEYLAAQGLSETFPQRFWSKVNKNGPSPKHCAELGPCWLWTAATNEDGYGVIGTGTVPSGLIRASRAAWVLQNGALPAGLDVLHHCDTPGCVRGTHLFAGTAETNGKDAAQKHRTKQGARHWNARLTESQVREIRARYVKWSKNHKQLPALYGISVVNLQNILYRRSWRHI